MATVIIYIIHMQILQGSVPVLMVTKGASWQQYLDSLLPPDGAAVVSLTSTLGSVLVILVDVSPMYLL
jgi:hypothetical protein